MNENDRTRLRHMLDAANEALSFIEGKERADLDRNRMLLLSVIKEIELIGEAAPRVSEDTCRALPQVPWRSIVGIRNRLIHGYFEWNLDVIWATLTSDVPKLIHALRDGLERT